MHANCILLERPKKSFFLVSRVFSQVRHHARRIKNRELLPSYTISETFADGGEGIARQQLGSRERCYQRDEETKRSLRIIESYDCLFRASLSLATPAGSACQPRVYQLMIAPSANLHLRLKTMILQPSLLGDSSRVSLYFSRTQLDSLIIRIINCTYLQCCLVRC